MEIAFAPPAPAAILPSMDNRLIDKQVLYDGAKVRLELHHIENPDGTRGKREIVVHPGAVVILPFVDAHVILLIRNHRHAISQYLVELPAGTLEKGEDPMNCAGRELQEETGHLAGRLERLGNFFSSPGILTERLYAFAAFDLQVTQTHLDEGEEIEVLPTGFDEALEMIRDGRIQDGKTIATLLLYDKYHRRG